MDAPGSRQAMIESLFHQYANPIYRYVRYTLHEDVDAADVVQEVFVRAFRAWDEFEGRADVKTWLFRIARNCVYDVLRKRRHEREYIAAQRVNRWLHAAELNTLIELEDVLQRMRNADQEILNLRLIQDLSVPETARILGWTEVKVRVNFHRARSRLRALLAESANDLRGTAKGGGKHEA